MPAGARVSQHSGGPAVAHPVADHPPQGHGPIDRPVHGIQVPPLQPFWHESGVIFMGIPALKEDVRFFKLKEKGVEAVFRQPINKVQYVFQAVRPFQADPPVGIGGGKVLLFRFQGLSTVKVRHKGAPLTGIEEHKADGPQVIIDPQQHISGGVPPKPGLALPDAVAVVRPGQHIHGKLQRCGELPRQHGKMGLQGFRRKGQCGVFLSISYRFVHDGPVPFPQIV